ncbi:MAG: helix-turn-helix domain-containing protein [Pseudomonadota bacterium]
MSAGVALIDPFIRGVAAGAILVLGLSALRAGISSSARAVCAAVAVSLVAWLITEAGPLWSAMGDNRFLMALAFPVAGLYWLFVITVFGDRPVTPLTLLPAGLLALSGFLTPIGGGSCGWLWTLRNLASAGLAIHGGVVILRSWRGDLIEGRRRIRGPLFALTIVFTLAEVALALTNRAQPVGIWMRFEVGEIYGGAIVAVLAVSLAVLFMELRPSLIGAPQVAETRADARAEAADRLAVERLQAAMAAEGWRREALTIGALASELDLPEHRLRRLINQRLGYRNFADFLNAHRIEAAKRRLADPAEARTTVAVIAFDLGYGSLGPFNRAFRASTGKTPSEWRRLALAETLPELQRAL